MITNVYQRKDGRFEGRITVCRIGGKRQYKAFFGRTPDDVITKMTDYRERIVETAAVCKTFSEVFDEWFKSISIRVKDSTLANYVLKAEKHILPVFANDDITDVKQSNIYQFMAEAEMLTVTAWDVMPREAAAVPMLRKISEQRSRSL